MEALVIAQSCGAFAAILAEGWQGSSRPILEVVWPSTDNGQREG